MRWYYNNGSYDLKRRISISEIRRDKNYLNPQTFVENIGQELNDMKINEILKNNQVSMRYSLEYSHNLVDTAFQLCKKVLLSGVTPRSYVTSKSLELFEKKRNDLYMRIIERRLERSITYSLARLHGYQTALYPEEIGTDINILKQMYNLIIQEQIVLNQHN